MSLNVLTQGGGTGGESASIFVKGLTEADTVTATKDGKTVKGKWVAEERKVSAEIPTMTSNTTPSGIASCSTLYSGEYDAYKAFDGSLSTKGWTPSSDDSFGNAYAQYEFDAPITPNRIDIAMIKGSGAGSITYKVVASADASEWDVLINSLDVSTYGVYYQTDINANKPYKYFKIIMVSGANGATLTNINGVKMQVYGTEEVDVRGHIITIKDYGLWTVTATNGEETAMQDVLVDAAVDFEIEMAYVLWLYREGEEFEDVTGGWISVQPQTYPMGIATKNENNLYLSAARQSAGWTFQKEIDVTEFTTLKAVITAQNAYNRINLYTGTAYPDTSIAEKTDSFGTNIEVSIDIANVSGNYKVHLGCWVTNSPYVTVDAATMTIYKVWLE